MISQLYNVLGSKHGLAKVAGIGALAALDYTDNAINAAGSVFGGVWVGLQTTLLTSATGIPPLAAGVGVAAGLGTMYFGLRATFRQAHENYKERVEIAAQLEREALEERAREPDTRPVRTKFSDAGKTARTPRPTFASRVIRAANDKARNAWGEGPSAMPVPA